MGLLDGDLREVFGSVFAPLLLDAVITRVTLVPDGAGGLTETAVTADAKGMVEQYSAYERARLGVPATDVKLILLQKDVPIRIDVHSKVMIRGQLYSVQDWSEDPAQASWTVQGRPILAPVGARIDAAATAIAGVGSPRLLLLINNSAEAVAQVHAPASPVMMDAEASAIAGVGAPVRLVRVEPEISAVAEVGAPMTASGFAAEVVAVAGVGTPQVMARVTAEAAAVASVGAPVVMAMIDVPVTAIAVAEAPFASRVEIAAPVIAIAGVGAVTRRVMVGAEAAAVAETPSPFDPAPVMIVAEAAAIAGVGAPLRRVLIAGDAVAIAEAGRAAVLASIDVEASAVAEAGSVTRRVLVVAEAQAVAQVGTVTRLVPVVAPVEALAETGAPVRQVRVAAEATAIVEAGEPEIGEPSGPGFDAFTLHAWDPDAGGNATGYVPDAVGARPLWIVDPTTGVIASWNGAMSGHRLLILDGTDAQATVGAFDSVTFTFWRYRNAGTPSFTPILGYGDGWTGDGASAGTFQLFGGDPSGHFFIKDVGGFAIEGEEETGNVAEAWEFYAVTTGTDGWKLFINGSETISLPGDTSNLNVDRILTFGPRHIAFDNTQSDHTDPIPNAPMFLDPWSGRFGDIRLHNKALSAGEVAALYAAGRQSY